MTIAVCYLSPEGVVLGAESTSSVFTDVGYHFFNFNQKIFEVGEKSTLGMVTWGLGGLGGISHRTLVAELADELAATPAGTVMEVAARWTDRFWAAYDAFPPVLRARALAARPAHDPTVVPPAANARTVEEEGEFRALRDGMYVGFCLAGYVLPDRTTYAARIGFDPLAGKPVPAALPQQWYEFWGVPNIISRLIHGCDQNLREAILNSGKWSGTADELDAVLQQQRLTHATLPIRDAIDYVYSCIHATIKAMKFSSMGQVCGGPIEIAVITSDRRFRWVRHKPWDAAITDGDLA